MLNWFSRHPWTFWFLVIALVFISAFPLLLKTSITQGLQSYAKDYGIEKVTLNSIGFNPFSGSLVVQDLQLYKTAEPKKVNNLEAKSEQSNTEEFNEKNTKTALKTDAKAVNLILATHIKQLDIEIKMLDLFKQRLNVEHLIFSDANLPITIDAENQVYLAGIKLFTPTEEKEAAKENSELPFQLALKSLSFSDINVPVTFKGTDIDLQIKTLTLSNLESWSDEFARLIMHARVNQQDIRSNLQLHLFQQQPEIIGTLKTPGIDLAAFKPLLPNLGFDFKTQFATDMTFTASQTEQGFELFQQGETTLQNTTFKQDNNNVNSQDISWNGDAIIKQNQAPQDSKTAVIEAQFTGKLNSKNLALQQANSKAKVQNINWNGDLNFQQFTAENENPAAQKITLNGALQAQNLNLQQATKQIKLTNISSQGSTQVSIKNSINVALNQVIKATQFNLQDSVQSLNLNSDVQINTKSNLALVGENLKLNHQGSFTANSIALQQKALKITVNKVQSTGPVTLTSNKTTALDLQQDIHINEFSLQDDEQQLSLTSNATVNADTQIRITKGATEVNHKGDIELSNLKATQEALLATLQSLKWQGTVNINQQPELQLATTGNLAINTLAVNNQTLQRGVLSAETINIDQLDVNKAQQIKTKNINIKQLEVGDKRLKDNHGLLTTLQNLAVNSIELSPAKTEQQALQIHLGDISLNRSQTYLTLDKDSELLQLNELLASLPLPNENKATNSAKANTEGSKTVENTGSEKPAPKPIYSVKSVQVSGNNPVFISANNVKPPVNEQIALQNLSLEGFDSQSPNQSSAYKVKIEFDEFSYLDSKGTVAVLNPAYALKAKTEVESFPLTNLSGLSEQSIGYVLESGQLSAELDTELNQKKITAKNDVKIHKLELKAGDSDIAKKQQANFPVPLETGIAMLQDKNGNIKLSIPVKGDIDNPDFNINDVINTALGKAMAGATRTYLLLALQPFGAIALAGEMAINKAGEIDLESISFEPASADITPKMQQYLAKLSELLKERKALSIKLCEGASQSEKLALQEQLIKTDIEKQSQAGVKNIKVPDINVTDTELLELATERQIQIKRALIQLGVKAKQVIFCKPSIQENTEPKVKLKI